MLAVIKVEQEYQIDYYTYTTEDIPDFSSIPYTGQKVTFYIRYSEGNWDEIG